MTSSRHGAAPSKLVARIAVAGMSLAVASLGALAVWAAIVTQNGADGLTRTGVQTSGHLRAVLALSTIDTQADALEERIIPAEVEKLRGAQRVLDDGLVRMGDGGIRRTRRISEQTERIVGRLKPAIDRFLARPSGVESAPAAEEELEEILTELQVLLNDLDADPSRLLATELESVTATERTVERTAFVLIPIGLGSVAACAWLLSLYRRRSEAIMRAEFDMTAQEARTDELTGLPNRRALLEELDGRTAAEESFTLTIADLNGFKRYNDTFGHPAGDALLRRLGRKLAAACDGHGIAARLGGDEFCVLFFSGMSADRMDEILMEALSDAGEGYHITASTGAAAVPEEARDGSGALRLADSRMYAAKVGTHPSAEQGISDALTRMLDERHPGLGSHVEEVAQLAGACAERLGLPPDEVGCVQRAAELHDIGKVAIPSELLTKQGPLSDEEWEFMRRHSIIGERILAGVSSLQRVAVLVRSSHERWDGAGYPDCLSGEEIPLGARIIFVADAYCAMTEDRPYAEARSEERTREELAASSGSQFDPAVVAAFLSVLDNLNVREVQLASPAVA